MIQFSYKNASQVVERHEMANFKSQVAAAHDELMSGSGAGNDFLGWIRLPEDYDRDEFARIQVAAQRIQSDSDVLVVVGIGGSYLGARAVIELLGHNFNADLSAAQRKYPRVIFAGNNLSGSYLADLFDVIADKRVSVNVISKSGTTTESAIVFRIFNYMKSATAEEARRRIYARPIGSGCPEDPGNQEGYESFIVPMTWRPLLGLDRSRSVADCYGVDIEALMAGAATA